MFTHEDKTDINDTKHSAKLAAAGKKRVKKYSNKKADKFRKSGVKRG